MENIKTYNDLLALGENEQERVDFITQAINEHKGSELYHTAFDADLYYKHQNPTIMRYQKFVYNRFGQKVPNTWSANNRIASNWYSYFVDQAVQYLLGNGVSFNNDETKDRLGKDFDYQVQKAATEAKIGGVSFGFLNVDHIEIFSVTEFAPLFDEEDGGLKAGIRFWQIADNKPLRCTLYEMDGYTDYIKRKEDPSLVILKEKTPYQQIVVSTEADGPSILDGKNYDGFPIVPFWNVNRQSDLVGNRGTLDAYDLMISGLINNVSDGEFLYWILENCDGMSDDEVVQFIEGLALNHVAKAGHGEEGSKVTAEKAEVPFEATSEALTRLKDQLYHDFMALNVEQISAGATNDQIQAAYEPLNQRTDRFENQVSEFILGVLKLAGIDDEPTYDRSQLSNRKEIIETILESAEYLDSEYLTTKILMLLGDADKVDDVIRRKTTEEAQRYSVVGRAEEEEESDEEESEAE